MADSLQGEYIKIMKKLIFGLIATVMLSASGFANNSAKEVKKVALEGGKKAKTEKLARCSVDISPGNTLTLNCGTCSSTECLDRLKNILKNQKPSISME